VFSFYLMISQLFGFQGCSFDDLSGARCEWYFDSAKAASPFDYFLHFDSCFIAAETADFNAFAASPRCSKTSATNISSVPIELCPNLLASSCASMITFMAPSVNLSNIVLLHSEPSSLFTKSILARYFAVFLLGDAAGLRRHSKRSSFSRDESLMNLA